MTFVRYESDPDPVVAALAVAHGAALRAGEKTIAKSCEAQIRRLADPAYGMYSTIREAVRIIDQLRYHHGVALSNIKVTPTSGSGLGDQGDEWFANLASRLTQAAAEYSDSKGWTS